LHLLRSSAVWSALPPGTTRVGHLAETPALWDYTQGGWSGAGVSAGFVGSVPAAMVFAFYAQRAGSAGWATAVRDGLGYVSMWTREYPGGIGANLSLYYVRGDPAVVGSPVT
jgi:hypothetical protein